MATNKTKPVAKKATKATKKKYTFGGVSIGIIDNSEFSDETIEELKEMAEDRTSGLSGFTDWIIYHQQLEESKNKEIIALHKQYKAGDCPDWFWIQE